MPAHHSYNELIWNTYPISNSTSALPIRKWNVSFNNLTDAGITFEKINVVTDGASITSRGISAAEGYFQTSGGPIAGEYTIPTSRLVFNTSGGGSFGE